MTRFDMKLGDLNVKNEAGWPGMVCVGWNVKARPGRSPIGQNVIAS